MDEKQFNDMKWHGARDVIETEEGLPFGFRMSGGQLLFAVGDPSKWHVLTPESTRRLLMAAEEHFHPPIRVGYCPDVGTGITDELLEELSRSRVNWMELPPQRVEFLPVGEVIINGQILEPGVNYHFPVDGGVAKVTLDGVEEPLADINKVFMIPIGVRDPVPPIKMPSCEELAKTMEAVESQGTVEEPLIVAAERTEGVF